MYLMWETNEMKHIWICQCGESGLGVKDYVEHMHIYTEIDELTKDTTSKECTNTDTISNKFQKLPPDLPVMPDLPDEDFEKYMNRKRTKEDIESLEEADKFYDDKQ